MNKIKILVGLMAICILIVPAFSFSEKALIHDWKKKIAFQEAKIDGKYMHYYQPFPSPEKALKLDWKKEITFQEAKIVGKHMSLCQGEKNKIGGFRDFMKDGKQVPACQGEKNKIDSCQGGNQIIPMMGKDSKEMQCDDCNEKTQ